MTDFSPLDSALYESTPEKIAASLRYLRKTDAVMAALMPLVASPSAPVCVCGEPTLGVVHRADGPCYLPERVAPAAMPAGNVPVPVEPTQAMLDAGHAAAWRRIPSCFDMTDAEIVYRAMLAAARKGE